ncbi:hypothetical protein [Halorarius litoreus]|uniref:hypothetical protein n=1 Tax=Halorarius litoreus TaxID=2962676 RepID=UPI0020CDB1BD|nr:hypothetical protein [Halorarius litoreus]
MSDSNYDAVDAGEPTRLQSVVKLTLGAIVLVVLGSLLSLVPPLSRPLPGTPISIETAILGVFSVVVLGLFVAVADEFEAVVAERLDGPERVVGEVAAVAKYLVVFLAFIAVYEPLARAVVPFLAGADVVWLFDLGYSVVALGLLAIVGVLVYRNLDPVAALVTDYVGSSTSHELDGRDAT